MGFVNLLRDGKAVGDEKGPRPSTVFQRFNKGGSSRFWRSTCASVRASVRTRVCAHWHLEAIHSVKRGHEGAKSDQGAANACELEIGRTRAFTRTSSAECECTVVKWLNAEFFNRISYPWC